LSSGTRTEPPNGTTFEDLLAVVRRLRDPGGCPWDREQTHASLRQHLLEETYETLEAIESGDPAKLREELGDLLTHVSFHTDMAARAGEFTPADLFRAVVEKLVRRHPHVFGDGQKLDTAGQVVEQWDEIKRKEGGRDSVLDGIPPATPALALAATLQRRAAKAGLTWDGEDSFEPRHGEPQQQAEERAGAFLWAAVRRLHEAGVDPETALRAVALRFQERVRKTEALAGGRRVADLPAQERAKLWQRAGRD
jgi:MazG family protein